MQIKKRRLWIIITSAVVAILLIIFTSLFVWYKVQLNPADASNTDEVLVEIKSGTTPDQIAEDLKEKQLIRSPLAFSIYAKLHNLSNGLQAGLHRLSASQSTPDIAEKLQQAENEDLIVQFVPGAMLRDNSSTDDDKKQDIRSTLEKLGYDRDEIEQAFEADYSEYDDTLFKGRSAGADIEGYIWGDTYYVERDTAVEQIFRRTFDEYVKVIEQNDLEAKFEAQGLTLFQGITLASIVQREVSCSTPSESCDDQKQVAQVFLKRLSEDMALGSVVTFIYAASQDGKTPTVDYDSPYNTRVHKGLPPGPISSPGLGALLAVAEPAEGDYLYFVAGDDGVTYFTRTEEEHNEAVRNHCQVNCLLSE